MLNSIFVSTNEKRQNGVSEEAKYYSLLLNYARLLAPLYNAFFDCLTLGRSTRLRDFVADFARLKKGSIILDVATGTGKQAYAFAKKGHNVIGIDLSENMIKIAATENKSEKVQFEIAEATRLPFADNSFDVSCVSFGLHDMIPSIRERALKEIVRVTKSNGTFIIVDYDLPKNGFVKFVASTVVRLYEPYFTEFIKSDLESLLESTGIHVTARLTVLFGTGRILEGKRHSALLI